MRHIREILRQKLLLGHTHRMIAASVGVSAGGVGETVSRANQAGFSTWQEVEALEERELAARLYGVKRVGGPRPAPDPAELDVELRRKGVTLQLLHIEYLGRHPDGYRYTQFCNLYRAWKKRQGVVMRQIHRGGEKLFVDYSGVKPRIWSFRSSPARVSQPTGESRPTSSVTSVARRAPSCPSCWKGAGTSSWLRDPWISRPETLSIVIRACTPTKGTQARHAR